MAKTLSRPPDAVLYDRLEALPARWPYTLDQVLDPRWYPTNVHGIEDPAL